jgi:hypothetical protein
MYDDKSLFSYSDENNFKLTNMNATRILINFESENSIGIGFWKNPIVRILQVTKEYNNYSNRIVKLLINHSFSSIKF